jgi:hypothetical protein
MVIYHPYVDAVQWLGTNVIEIRQFVRANGVSDVVIQAGILYIGPPFPTDAAIAAGAVPMAVPVNNWVVSNAGDMETYTTDQFNKRYQL